MARNKPPAAGSDPAFNPLPDDMPGETTMTGPQVHPEVDAELKKRAPELVDAAPPAKVELPEQGESPPLKLWRVLNGPVSVMLNHVRTTIPQGKVLDERHYNVPELRTQGVHVQEVDNQGAAIH